jgi:HAMP domain-containing protein
MASKGRKNIQYKDKGLGLRGKILVTFTVMALIPLLVIGFFTTLSITDLGDKSIEDSTEALRKQANSDLSTQTSDKAVQVEQFFMDVEDDCSFLMDFAYDVYNNPEKYDVIGYPGSIYDQNSVPYLPDWGYVHTANDERNGAWADWDMKVQTCPYLNSSVVNRAATDPGYAVWLRNEINMTLAFDHTFKPIYDNNQPNVQLVWMVRAGGLTNSYSVPQVDYGDLLATGELTDDWDEDSEDYVTLANQYNNPQKKVIWTEPYFDTVGNGWLVSCIAPIYKGTSFIGSVGIDIQLDMILNTVLDITMYDTGHAFLIDGSGNTIAHQDLDDERQRQMGIAEENTDVNIQSLESSSDEFKSMLNNMDNADYGLETVTYDDDKDYYIGYEKIHGTDFILGIVVPEEEVLESVKVTEENISETTNETMLLVLVINGIALVFILVIGLALANRIIAPINEMIEVSQQLGSGEIDEDVFDIAHKKISKRKTKPDEIGTFYRAFKNMVQTINQNAEEEKKKKKKEFEPIPQQLVQDIKIEIKDSVIHRSSIGVPGKGKPGQTRYCLNCGKDLPPDFTGQFCPYCGEEP